MSKIVNSVWGHLEVHEKIRICETFLAQGIVHPGEQSHGVCARKAFKR